MKLLPKREIILDAYTSMLITNLYEQHKLCYEESHLFNFFLKEKRNGVNNFSYDEGVCTKPCDSPLGSISSGV